MTATVILLIAFVAFLVYVVFSNMRKKHLKIYCNGCNQLFRLSHWDPDVVTDTEYLTKGAWMYRCPGCKKIVPWWHKGAKRKEGGHWEG